MGVTLAGPAHLRGVGLHSGQDCQVQLRPGSKGLRFVDLADPTAPPIPVHVDGVSDTTLATTLRVGGRTVQTVEHLLSAAMGLGITDMDVAIDGTELPILDGTAGAWARAIQGAGTVGTGQSAAVLVIDKPVRISQGHSWVEARPAGQLQMTLSIDFDHPMIGRQEYSWSAGDDFVEALGWARTFGFERDVLALKEQGLIAGGTLDNAVVFSEQGVLNPDGLRASDEPVRHKAMDLLGDLALLGHPVRGHFLGHRPGHGRVIALVRAILSDRTAWHLERVPDP